MGARSPKAAGNSSPFGSADHPFCSLGQSAVDVEESSVSIEAVGSPCYRNTRCQDGPSHEEQHGIDRETCSRVAKTSVRHHARSPSSVSGQHDIPEQLAELLMKMISGSKGEELADAFLNAAELPPITKQSLSELDIQNIITNIKLRHDVNFDHDLSFRPNFDGAKGQEKMKAASKYWTALVAELELYARLFQGSPPLSCSRSTWLDVVRNVQRRIPKMFETIREVLKSLVPDRDHLRVDEHLDVPMLMQEIERGVCDLVRLAEWMAHLLKEHCAPMRDQWVDKMVEDITTGVTCNSSERIVDGLRGLMGIFEAMKLVSHFLILCSSETDQFQDVANHQIRNLKTLLIEDTVNFERHHHLDRLVNGRARVNVESAHQWYESASARFRQLCMPPQRDIMRLKLEIFVRAVVSTLFTSDAQRNFPETFYLDQDRLRSLKSEIDELVYFEICLEMFGRLLKELGYSGMIPLASRQRLHASLSAIVGERVAHGPSQWIVNSEHISLELIRQALALSGQPPSYDLDTLVASNRHLRTLFLNRFHNHALTLESYILPQVLSCVNRNLHSPPMDLFNNLVGPSPPPPPQTSSHPPVPNRFSPKDTLPSHPEHSLNLSNRITHIILLHWRIWGPIAYVLEDPTTTTSNTKKSDEGQHSTSSSPSQTRNPSTTTENNTETPIITAMKTGEPPDPGTETLEYAGRSLQ